MLFSLRFNKLPDLMRILYSYNCNDGDASFDVHFLVTLKDFLVVALSGTSIYNATVKTGNILYLIFFHSTQKIY